jgi:prophage regulatory protein
MKDNEHANARALPCIMRLPEVMQAVGMSRPSIYRLMKLGKFPQQMKLGVSAVGWLQTEVQEWFEERANARNVGTPMQCQQLAA